MTLSTREYILAIVTLAVILFGGTFYVGDPMWKEYKSLKEERQRLADRERIARRLLERQGEINERLDALRQEMPTYPAELDVTSQLLKSLQKTADQHGLVILRQEPDRERHVGDLYEMAISCAWQGELNSLIHFLYAMQFQGAIVDFRQLSIAPVRGEGLLLKGNFIVDFAYSRIQPGAGGSAEEPAAPETGSES